ncbi:helix-turn-helix transcriptional regulator [Actinoplanes sp. N902-109]|uniref:helix-turn-helix transcriptional regulator n=1 Tax=Actinoplanes sp. (strain N902-109) TaxID=649831 RepID=UPI0005A30235|nr:helix-turn-helix transcriptional regulator [Actinoplanes sp. N902-109]
MATAERRQELAQFIRSRRDRRKPEDVGLHSGRRRTPGLRREEVATLAGVSVTWYTWLEQGRDIRVSRQVLGSLARALGLGDVERDHLFRLAGEVPPDDAAKPDDLKVLPQHELLLANLDPNPAFIVNRRFDIVAWNRGCTLLYGDLDRLSPEHRNVLWLTFHSPDVRAMAENWEIEASQTLALFRTQVGEGLSEPDVAALIATLDSTSADFHRLWRLGELAPFVPKPRVVRHPKLGEVELEYVKMHVAGEGKTLVSYLAEPGSELAARLQELVHDT